MSAFMHGDKHVAFIVAKACTFKGFVEYELGPMTKRDLAQLLLDCNADNILAKYGDENHHEIKNIGALFAQVSDHVEEASLGQFVQAVRSLRYQCCDWDGFEGSEGQEWLKRLLVCAAEEVPGQDEGSYWSIN